MAQYNKQPYYRAEIWWGGTTYSAAWGNPTGNVVANPSGYICVGQLHTYSGFPRRHYYKVYRSMVKFNLSTLPPCTVTAADFESKGAWATRGLYARAYDGTGLTGVPADYYNIRLLTSYVGQGTINPCGWSPNLAWDIVMNAAGRALIASKAGGTLILALRCHWEQASNPPPSNYYDEFFPQKPPDICTLHITYDLLPVKDNAPARKLTPVRKLTPARKLTVARVLDPILMPA